MSGTGTGWYVGGTLGAGVPGSESDVYIPAVFDYTKTSPASPLSAGSGEDYTAILAGPFTTQAAAQAWAAEYSGGSAPDSGVSTNTASTAKADSSSEAVLSGNSQSNLTPAVSSWETAIEGFFQAFTSASLWIRVAKVTGGGIILIVGLAKLTGADQKIGGIAATAVKAAPLL